MKDQDFFVSKFLKRGRSILALVLGFVLVFSSLELTRAETVEHIILEFAALEGEVATQNVTQGNSPVLPTTLTAKVQTTTTSSGGAISVTTNPAMAVAVGWTADSNEFTDGHTVHYTPEFDASYQVDAGAVRPTITVNFKSIPYDIIVNDVEWGRASADVSNASHNDPVILTVVPMVNCSFVRWDVDSHNVTPTATGVENQYTFNMPNGPVTLTPVFARNKLQLPVPTLNQTSFVYDGSAKTPVITVKDGDKTLALNADYTVSGDLTKTDKGDYKITVTGTGDYAGTQEIDWHITQKPLTVTENVKTYDYDGNSHVPTFYVKDGGSEISNTVTFCATENGTYVPDPGCLNAGTYNLYYKITPASDNYQPKTGRVALTIRKKALSVTADNKTVMYGSTTPLTYQVTGLVGADQAASVMEGTLLCNYDGENVGTYPIERGSLNVKAGTNYSLGTFTSGTMTVTAKSASTLTVTASDVDAEDPSGGPWETAIEVKDGAATLIEGQDYEVLDTSARQVTAWGAENPVMTQTVTISGKGNYSGTKSCNWKLTDREIPTGTVTALETFWDHLLENVTFGLYRKNAQTVRINASDTGSGVKSLSYYVSEESLGENDAEIRAALDNITNWTAAADPAEVSFTVDPEKKCVIYAKIKDKAGKINYVSSNGFTLDATAPVITGVTEGETYYHAVDVTAEDAVKLKTVTLNGEAKAVTADSMTFTIPVPDTDTQYTVYAEDAAGNTASKSFYVNPKKNPPYTAESYTVSYDGKPHSISVNVSQVTGSYTVEYKDDKTGAWSTECPAYTNVGTHTTTFRITYEDERYNDMEGDTATVSITKAPLTITPNPGQSKIYLQEDPFLTYKVEGLVNNEKAAEAVTGALERAAGDNAGLYEISQGTVIAPNYEITFTAGVKFEIKPRSIADNDDITVLAQDAFVYTGAAIKNEVTVRDERAKTLGYPEILTEGTDYTVVGNEETDWSAEPYTITVTGIGNYTGTVTRPWRIEDHVQPKGSILLGTSAWKTFLNTITFGHYFNDTKKVTITAEDLESGVQAVEYQILNRAPEGTTEAEILTVLSAGTWNALSNGGSFTIDPNEDYVIYARITDKAGNAAIINSDGLVLDNVPPEITGVEDGATYVHSVVFKVSDLHLASVTVDGEEKELSESYSIEADDTAHKIEAKDQAGNITTFLINLVKPVSESTITDEETYEKGIIVSEVNFGPGTPDMSVGGFNAKVAKSVCTPEELYELKNNAAKIEVYLDVLRIEGSTLPEQDRLLVEQKAKQWNKKVQFPMFLDISLYKQNGTVHKLTGTNGKKVKIGIEVPSDLRPESEKIVRTYAIYRVHDGAAKQLVKSKKTKFTFETDQFSTYALVYYDTTKKDQNGGNSGGNPGVGGQNNQNTNPGGTGGGNGGVDPNAKDPALEAALLAEIAAQQQQTAGAAVVEGTLSPATNAAAPAVTGATGNTKAPKTGDDSNMPLWVIGTFLLLIMLFFLTLMGRNFGLFPYPTKEQQNRVIKRICNVGNHHRRLRYLMFFIIVGYVFILNIYKHIFFSEAARKTYAKA